MSVYEDYLNNQNFSQKENKTYTQKILDEFKIDNSNDKTLDLNDDLKKTLNQTKEQEQNVFKQKAEQILNGIENKDANTQNDEFESTGNALSDYLLHKQKGVLEKYYSKDDIEFFENSLKESEENEKNKTQENDFQEQENEPKPQISYEEALKYINSLPTLKQKQQDEDIKNSYKAYLETKDRTFSNAALELAEDLGKKLRGEINVNPNLATQNLKFATDLWHSKEEIKKLNEVNKNAKKIDYTEEEYKKLYLESLNNKKLLYATEEQTQRFLQKNNLNDDFIKLYNKEAREHHFSKGVFENAVVFAKAYRQELKEKAISSIKDSYSTLEHFHETYNDSLAYFKSLGGFADKDDIKALQTTKDNLNKDLKNIFNDMGYDLFISDYKMIATHKQTGFRFNLYDEKDSLVQSLLSNKGEIAGALAGAYAGSKTPLPFGGKVVGTLVGGLIGGSTGASIDYFIDTIKLAKEFNTKDMLNKAGKSAMYDLATAGVFKGIGGVTKGGFYLVKNNLPNFSNKLGGVKNVVMDTAKSRIQSFATGGLSKAQVGLKNNDFIDPNNIKLKKEVEKIHKELDILTFDKDKLKPQIAPSKNIIDGTLNFFIPITKQRLSQQNEILAYVLAQPKYAEQLVEMLKTNPNIHNRFIDIANKINSPLLEPLKKITKDDLLKYDEKIISEISKNSAQVLIGITREHKSQLVKEYQKVLEEATKTAEKTNVYLNTADVYDDLLHIIKSADVETTKERQKFLEFLHEKQIFLKDENGEFIKKQLNPNELNTINTSLSRLYQQLETHTEKLLWKEIKNKFSNHHMEKYLDDLNKYRTKAGEQSLSKMYQNARSRYAHYLEYINSDDFKITQRASSGQEKLVDVDKILKEQLDATSKIDINIDEYSNAINKRLETMTKEQRASYENALIVDLINKNRLYVKEQNGIFFDKENFINTLKKYNFQSKEAKEYTQMAEKINKLFSYDKAITTAKPFLIKDSKEESLVNLASSLYGKIHMFFVNGMFWSLMKHLRNDTNQALRYQLYSAIYNANSLEEVSQNLGKEINKLRRMPLFSKEKLKNVKLVFDTASKMQKYALSGNFDKILQLSPIGEIDEITANEIQNEIYFLNNNYEDNKLDFSKPIKYFGLKIPKRQTNEKLWRFLKKMRDLNIEKTLPLIDFHGKKIYVTKPKNSDRFTLHILNNNGEKEILLKNSQLYHINVDTLLDLFDE